MSRLGLRVSLLTIIVMMVSLAIYLTVSLPSASRTWAVMGPNLASEAWGLVFAFLFGTLLFGAYTTDKERQRSYELVVLPALTLAKAVVWYGGVFTSGFRSAREERAYHTKDLGQATRDAQRLIHLHSHLATVEDRRGASDVLEAATKLTEPVDNLSNDQWLDRYLTAAKTISGVMRSLAWPEWQRWWLDDAALQLEYTVKLYTEWRASGKERTDVYHWPPDDELLRREARQKREAAAKTPPHP